MNWELGDSIELFGLFNCDICGDLRSGVVKRELGAMYIYMYYGYAWAHLDMYMLILMH